MSEGSRKRRFIIGLLGIPFFIVSSFTFGYVAQMNANDKFSGIHTGDSSFLANIFPFSLAQAKAKPTYPIGDVLNNVILVDFKNNSDPAWDIDPDKLAFANTVLNGESGSLKSYIHDISYDKVKVNSQINTKTEGDFDGYIPSKERTYYLNTMASADPAKLEEELLRDIIEQYKVTLSTSTKEMLDTNDDGYIDNLTFVIRGKKDKNHSLLWPHQYTLTTDEGALPSVSTTTGDVAFKDYNIILGGASGRTSDDAGIFNEHNSDIGVIAHEYLHVYGFPDMYHNYKYDETLDRFVPLEVNEQDGDPLGKWDIMDNTISTSPQLPLVYTNKAYSPWGSNVPQLHTIQESKTGVTLQKVAYEAKADNIAIMLKVDATMNPLAQDEYFMVEYRKQEGWDSGLPQSGLLIYRVNLAVNHKNANEKINNFCNTSIGGNHCGNMFGAPDEVFIFRPNATDIQSGNKGFNTDINLDKAAISPLNERTSLGKTLADISKENIDVANLGDTIYFSDGSNSGIVLNNVVENADDTITFDIDFPKPIVDNEKPTIDDATGNGMNGNWSNGSPAVTLHVSDKGRGVENVTVSTIDGEIMEAGNVVKTLTTTYASKDPKNNVNFEFKANKNGTYKVIAIDYAGNVSSEKIVNVTNIDHVLPEIVVGDTTKSESKIRLKVTFKDEDSRINAQSAFYTTIGMRDATTALTYDQVITNDEIVLDVTFQGKVCIRVKDNAGNAAKEPSCWTISNDNIAPTITITSSQLTNTWTNGSIAIAIATNDDSNVSQTGISTIEVTTSDGRIDHINEKQMIKDFQLDGTTNEEIKVDVKANGTYQINVCDFANNCSKDTYVVTNIDQEAPVITKINVENKKEMALFSTTAHTISFEAHDEPISKHSGLKEIRYQFVKKGDSYIEDITNPIWEMISINAVLETAKNDEGMLYAYAIDNVGNVSKIAQKEIKRVSSQLPNEAFDSGIIDTSGKVNIIGIDSDVKISLKEVDMAAVKEKLGTAFLASHEVQDVYDILLQKDGSTYKLANEVTVRFVITQTLRSDGTLKLVAIDENGKTNEVAMTLGEDYVEFKTETLSMFALVSELTQKKDVATTLDNTPITGGESRTLLHVMFLISMSSLLILMMKKKYDTLNILDK